MKKIFKISVTVILLIAISIFLFSCSSEQEKVEAKGRAENVISLSEVKQIIIERVPGSTEENIIEIEGEYEDNKYEYEGSMYYGGYKYEFEIDGYTGNILSWEIDD